jgi:hypothetical protein
MLKNGGAQSSTAEGEVLQDQQNKFNAEINTRACRGGQAMSRPKKSRIVIIYDVWGPLFFSAPPLTAPRKHDRGLLFYRTIWLPMSAYASHAHA